MPRMLPALAAMGEAVGIFDVREIANSLGERDGRRLAARDGGEPRVGQRFVAVEVARGPARGEGREEADPPESRLPDPEAHRASLGLERHRGRSPPRAPGELDRPPSARGARAAELEGRVALRAGHARELARARDGERAEEDVEEVEVVDAHVREDAAARESALDAPATRSARPEEAHPRGPERAEAFERFARERDLWQEAIILGNSDERRAPAEATLERARALERRLGGLLDEDGLP